MKIKQTNIVSSVVRAVWTVKNALAPSKPDTYKFSREYFK